MTVTRTNYVIYFEGGSLPAAHHVDMREAIRHAKSMATKEKHNMTVTKETTTIHHITTIQPQD